MNSWGLFIAILLCCSTGWTQDADLKNGTLPLYHIKPGEVSKLISHMTGNYADSGARQNHRKYLGDAFQIMQAGTVLGAEMMGPCLDPLPGNPIACGMALAAFNEAGIAAGSGLDSDEQQQILASLGQDISDVNKAALAAQIVNAQNSVSILEQQGYKLLADGKAVATPGTPPLTLNIADLASDQALLAAGFTQGQIGQVKQTLDELIGAQQPTAIANRGAMPPSANGSGAPGNFFVPNLRAINGGSRPAVPRALDHHSELSGGTGTVRDPSATAVDKLSINFNGTPIGVAAGNMFNNVSDTYQNLNLPE